LVFVIRQGEALNISGNGTATISIDIPAGVTFKIHKLMFKWTGNFKLTRIYDTGAKLDYLVGHLHEDQTKDTAGRKFELPVPIEVTGATKLKFDITDTSGTTNNVYIACVGEE